MAAVVQFRPCARANMVDVNEQRRIEREAEQRLAQKRRVAASRTKKAETDVRAELERLRQEGNELIPIGLARLRSTPSEIVKVKYVKKSLFGRKRREGEFESWLIPCRRRQVRIVANGQLVPQHPIDAKPLDEYAAHLAAIHRMKQNGAPGLGDATPLEDMRDLVEGLRNLAGRSQ